jgi:hypothetical protein
MKLKHKNKDKSKKRRKHKGKHDRSRFGPDGKPLSSKELKKRHKMETRKIKNAMLKQKERAKRAAKKEHERIRKINRKANAYNHRAHGRCAKADGKTACGGAAQMPMIAPPSQGPAPQQNCLTESCAAGAAMSSNAIQQ